jgi:hypothetical protein
MTRAPDVLAVASVELRHRVERCVTLTEPLAGVVEEHLADDVVELTGLTVAGESLAGAFADPAVVELTRDLLTALADGFAARLGLIGWPEASSRIAAVLPRLLPTAGFDGVVGTARTLLPAERQPARLAYAVDLVAADADRLLDIHRAEWCDAEPAVVSAGGADLVLRLARLLVAAALVAWATADGGALPVTAARRYAWRWLRDPVPEAATPRHRTRTAELLRAAFGPAGAARRHGPAAG